MALGVFCSRIISTILEREKPHTYLKGSAKSSEFLIFEVLECHGLILFSGSRSANLHVALELAHPRLP